MSKSKDSLKNNQKNKGGVKSGRGGAREGAGRPKGSMNPEKKEALDHFKARVRNKVDQLFNAQLNTALGCAYLFRKETKINKKGKEYEVNILVTDPEEIKAALDNGLGALDDSYYYITTEKPDNKAIDSMLDRTFGKAPMSIDHTSKGKRIKGYTRVTVKSVDDLKKLKEYGGESTDSDN